MSAGVPKRLLPGRRGGGVAKYGSTVTVLYSTVLQYLPSEYRPVTTRVAVEKGLWTNGAAGRLAASGQPFRDGLCNGLQGEDLAGSTAALAWMAGWLAGWLAFGAWFPEPRLKAVDLTRLDSTRFHQSRPSAQGQRSGSVGGGAWEGVLNCLT
jgi:hypothetical protein